MKSAVRQRHVQSGEQPKIKKKVSWDSKSLASSMRRGRGPVDPYLSWYFILLYLLLMVVMSTISLHFFCQLPEAVTGEGRPNMFHSQNARGHMEDLVALGVRHVGSEANEVQAKNLILRKLETIRSKASEDIEIEVSIQHPSASYFLDFLGGLTHIYHNVTNIVARLSRKGTDRRNAFLVNAHFDSALGTVAASDDALSCGIMLEAIRSLSSDPAPLQGEHALIFLFNGAEETILQASHGFITQHPWAKTVRAFLNLEAAGAGGKEIVFQTGPDHPWLAELYSESVPHPHASIVAQEVFQSGIIPSDTDFRIFRDFGHVPGIDTAYFVNGYVYHTE